MNKVSIILPSYFRAELLDFGLKSLSRQIACIPIEIIVLNDGIEDNTKQVCEKYKNVRYVFTGERNKEAPEWRIAGEVLNKGVEMATGRYIIISSAEIYHLQSDSINKLINPLFNRTDFVTIPEGKDDTKAIFLNYLKTSSYSAQNDIKMYQQLTEELNTTYHFCIGMHKGAFKRIKGFDEKYFGGFAFDDDAFKRKLLLNEYQYKNVDTKIVHLYHSRKPKDRIGLANRDEKWEKNKKIYETAIVEPVKKPEPKIEPEIKPVVVIKPPTVKPPEPKRVYFTVPERLENKDNTSTQWYLEKIPKVAHFYWGEEKLPYMRYLTVESFVRYNPDWKVKFYYPKYRQTIQQWNTFEQKYAVNIKKDYYEELKKLDIELIEMDFSTVGIDNDLSEVYKSDFFRWYLLSTEGGLWSDMDIIYIDSMNNLSLNVEENKFLDTLISDQLPWGHSVGFLLSSKNNEIYTKIWNATKNRFDKENYQSVGSILINFIIKNLKTTDAFIGNISMNTVYAYNTFLIPVIFGEPNLKYITKETLGVHWYAGHPLAKDMVNQATSDNYYKLNNTISQIISISNNKSKRDILSKPQYFSVITRKKDLTIHSVVKNEPFIYYSIKSVYDYADKILLYDTGSDDLHTLEDIQRLLDEDTLKKITFKQIPLDFDESKWTYEKVDEFAKKHYGKMSVGKVRQMQLDDTDTEYCMVVDGDEVHYASTISTIKHAILPLLHKKFIGINIPLTWFSDLTHTFFVPNFENTGRIWKTKAVKLNDVSPNESHCFKETGIPVARTDEEYLIYKDIKPYAHFETFLKPWRRDISQYKVSNFHGLLPEVMQDETIIERYLLERKKHE